MRYCCSGGRGAGNYYNFSPPFDQEKRSLERRQLTSAQSNACLGVLSKAGMVDRGGVVGGGIGARPWYHRALGRMDSERMLVECGQDGAFLIRASETMRDAYVLSLM